VKDPVPASPPDRRGPYLIDAQRRIRFASYAPTIPPTLPPGPRSRAGRLRDPPQHSGGLQHGTCDVQTMFRFSEQLWLFTSYGISAVIPFRGFAVCPLQCARDGAVLTMLKLHGMSFRPCDMREKEIVIRASLGATRSRLVDNCWLRAAFPRANAGVPHATYGQARGRRHAGTSVRLSHRPGSFYTASKHLDYLLATLTVHSASCRRIENLPMQTARGPMISQYLVLGHGMRLAIIAFVLGR